MPISRHRSDDQFSYEGFAGPNGTIVPDDVFDVLAPRLTEAELRVLLYVVRRTFGFGKNSDAISLRQLTDGIVARDGRILDYGTGMSRKGVIGGIRGLLAKGIINVHRAIADDGDNEVNVYSLRFRDGVVTSGNYPGYRSTPPGVTGGNPQDSALQDSVGQQQPGPALRAPSGARGSVVAHSDHNDHRDHTLGRPDLYEMLRDLGVHQHTATKLLREHDHELVERVGAYVAERLERGWAPQESVAGWVVAAVTKRYEIPGHILTARDRQARQGEELQAQERRRQEQRLEDERCAEELSRQRETRLAALGIEQNVDKTWRSVQGALRDQGRWSLAMSVCFLKRVESGLAILLAPAKVKGRLEAHMPDIERALSTLTGQQVRVLVQEL